MLENFDIAIIWECSTCGISQACTAGNTKAFKVIWELKRKVNIRHTFYIFFYAMRCYNMLSDFFEEKYNSSSMKGYMMKLVLFVLFSDAKKLLRFGILEL